MTDLDKMWTYFGENVNLSHFYSSNKEGFTRVYCGLEILNFFVAVEHCLTASSSACSCGHVKPSI